MNRMYILKKLNTINIEINSLLSDFDNMEKISAETLKSYDKGVKELAEYLLPGAPSIIFKSEKDEMAAAVAKGYGRELKSELQKQLSKLKYQDNQGIDPNLLETKFYTLITKIEKLESKRKLIKYKYEHKRQEILDDYEEGNRRRKKGIEKGNEDFKEKIRKIKTKELEDENAKHSKKTDNVVIKESSDKRIYVILGIIILILIALGVCLLIGSKVINNIKSAFELISNGKFNSELLSSLLKSVLGITIIAAPICLALYIWRKYESSEKAIDSKVSQPNTPLYTPNEIKEKANAEAELYAEIDKTDPSTYILEPCIDDFIGLSQKYFDELKSAINQ